MIECKIFEDLVGFFKKLYIFDLQVGNVFESGRMIKLILIISN